MLNHLFLFLLISVASHHLFSPSRYFDLYEALPPYEEMPDANSERGVFYDKCIEIIHSQKSMPSATEWEGIAVVLAFRYPILVESFYSGVVSEHRALHIAF